MPRRNLRQQPLNLAGERWVLGDARQCGLMVADRPNLLGEPRFRFERLRDDVPGCLIQRRQGERAIHAWAWRSSATGCWSSTYFSAASRTTQATETFF